MSTREEMLKWYKEGDLPWDDVLPPPEVIATIEELPSGRGLDVGCGYGRTAIYLAQRGWQVDGVDFIQVAVDEAQKRAEAASVEVNFYQADVTALDFLEPSYSLAVDVGCSHALDEQQYRQYAAHLSRLLAPGATYVQYVRVAQSAEDGGMDVALLRTILGEFFELTKIEHGKFMRGEDEWASAWVWWQRHAA